MQLKEWNEIAVNPNFPYDDYKASCDMLRAGISAIKYNFSNMNYRKVTIHISQNSKYLLYRDSGMNLEKRINIKKLKGLLYGASTVTFKAHRKRVLKTLYHY